MATKKSWRTSVAGWAVLVGTVMVAVGAFFDDDASTVADWAGVWDSLKTAGLGIGGVAAAFGLMKARDDSVSSEGTTASKDS